MIINEHIDADGTCVRTYLEPEGEHLLLRDDADLSVVIPVDWVMSVMKRYGRELDPAINVDLEAIDLGNGRRLGLMRYRAAVDVDSRAYLVLLQPDAAPVAALANGATAALRHLADRLASA